MQQLFIELYKYKPAWLELSAAERRRFAMALPTALGSLQERGLEILGYGPNDPATDHRADFDFFSVYRLPDAELLRELQAGIAESGWYDYFEQVNAGGPALTPAAALLQNVMLAPASESGPAVSPTSPYRKKSVTVLGSRMSYVDEGAGDRTIVFVHGDVMSSFLWRNVMPYVEGFGRVIAVDLIGAGDSEKLPDATAGSYGFATHAKHFSALMDQLAVGDDVVLVGHDWGSNVAFDWAMQHEDRVAGIAFAEALLPPFEWSDWPERMRGQFEFLRSPAGEQAVLEDNFFVNAAQHSMVRMLAPAELDTIVRPYRSPGESRRPTIDWPREVPFGDDRTATRDALEAQATCLSTSDTPKLHLAGVPGGIDWVGGRRRDAIAQYRNLSRSEFPGFHWTPEDNPHAFGEHLAAWLHELEDRRTRASAKDADAPAAGSSTS
ncbi:haloalkane dehalogenase [Amycolatopsis sp. NPDC047767]|uniref:haloalkane dehalogenase n=1 Tax=Amycolatopsis sp. NPDC047767 TaxID=3156765 RepID=UPI0034565C1A